MIYINERVPFSNSIAIDVETTRLDPFTGKLLIISIALPNGDVYLITNRTALDSVRALLVDNDVLKIAHNATFDVKWLRHYFKLGRIPNVFCTMQAEKLIYMGYDFGDYPVNLRSTLMRHFGLSIDKDTRDEFIEHPGFDVQCLTPDQIKYSALDVLYLHRLMESQLYIAARDNLGTVFDLENFCINATASLELGGQALNVEKWNELLTFMEGVVSDSQAAMYGIVRDHVLMYITKAGKEHTKRGIYHPKTNKNGINFNSGDQLKPLAHQLWDVHLPNTQAKTIEAIAQDFDTPSEAREFFEYLLKAKQWAKWIGYDLPKYINPVTNKCHPSFDPLGTVTGRYSSSEYNAQNIPQPQDGLNMRHCLWADTEDDVILRADYAQQEVRVGAAMAGDTALITACQGSDIYSNVGATLYSKPINKKDPERQVAKGAVLAMMYGAGKDRLMQATGQSEEEVIKTKNLMAQSFPEMMNYGRKVETFYNNNGYIMTRTGRRRYNVKGYSEFCNSPIQGTSADMMKIAMGNLEEALYILKDGNQIHPSTRLWTVVHDEIGVQCRADEAEKIAELINNTMLEAAHMLVPEVKHFVEIGEPTRVWDKG